MTPAEARALANRVGTPFEPTKLELAEALAGAANKLDELAPDVVLTADEALVLRSLVQTYVLDELDRGVVRRRWQAISSAFFSGTVTRGR